MTKPLYMYEDGTDTYIAHSPEDAKAAYYELVEEFHPDELKFTLVTDKTKTLNLEEKEYLDDIPDHLMEHVSIVRVRPDVYRFKVTLTPEQWLSFHPRGFWGSTEW